MRPLKILLLAAATLCGVSCARVSDDAVIPCPASVREYPGHFKVHSPLSLSVEAPDAAADALTDYVLATALPCRTDRQNAAKNYLRLSLGDDASLPASEEGYLLAIRPAGITIRSRGEAGLFYGLQTLLQLYEQFGRRIPAQEITDAPRFAYRGLHLDVSRHFFDKQFVRKQLRMMASLKLNRLHWHLTDGAGWRIAIDRYPLLTQIAAWRYGATWQEWRDGGARYCRFDDPAAQGGFYTKADIREVVAYADSLHITVIPEIEMPGHSEEVLAVYPELSCSGKPYVDADLCIGKEATFEFLENVLTEVMELFPSEYIHIGGDEATKKSWPDCPDCRARMARGGLKDVDELQSYAVRRIERFLNSRGRKLLGWDEILDGGLAPNASVMSWHGEAGGRKAAASGHPVVMTPVAYCYFDNYQGNPTIEPLALSGSLPLSKVYEYDPAPADMPGREHVLGVQANLWAEHISTPEHAEYMLYPRLFALAEVAWSDPQRKDYDDFYRRALLYTDEARAAGYNTFDLGSEIGERPESLEPVEHLAVGCPVKYATAWYEGYPGGGAGALTDGLRGSWTFGARWQGYLDCDVDVTVDLGAVKRIHEVFADFLQWKTSWIWMPPKVEIEASDDGKTFRPLGSAGNDVSQEDEQMQCRAFGWNGETEARYIRYRAYSNGRPGGWLFIDEVVIN